MSAEDFWNRISRKLKITSCFQSKPWLRSESLMLEFLFHRQFICWCCFTVSCWQIICLPMFVVLLMLFVYWCLLFYWCCLFTNICCFTDVVCLPMFVCQCLVFYWCYLLFYSIYWCYLFTDVCCFIDVVCLPMFVVYWCCLSANVCCFIDDYVYLLTAWGGPHGLDHESDPTRSGGTCLERH